MPAAFSSFLSLLDVMITCAPASFANCRAKIETPPVPCASTLMPGLKTQLVNAFQAVTAAHGSVAASSYDRCEGMCTTESCERTTYSANMPSTEPPSDVRALYGETSP